MTNHILSPDTQAILLLCASFGLSRTTEPKPLTLREYNNLAIWLKDNDLTPKDLLDSIIQNKLTQLVINQLESHRILALLKRGVMLSLAVEKWTNQGLWILSRGDAEYPKYLKQRLKHQAPAILYGVGNKKLLDQGGLAIVGSRDIDDAGLEYTQKLVETCVQQKIQIISGGARGVDRASMLGTMEAGGTVVGVMADSLAKAAVAKNYRRGIQEGRLTLISTYDPNAGFNVGNAMGRNKYIYALADYGLVVNSTVSKGGTWAGAIEALKKIIDVPVFVRIEKNTNQGNQKLIEQGAIPFPKIPGNIPLKVLIQNQILDFKNKQKFKSIVMEQTSLVDCNNIAESNFSENTTNFSKPEVKNNSLVNQTQFKLNNNQTQKRYNSQDIYEVVLPFILHKLETPQNDKFLAESLEIQLGQMRAWLKRAVEEGEIRKNKKPVTYELNKTKNLSLLNN
jgi:predicted Rossmann fold nucleotide-binding protein DprA/Smf involved in DNA uptake